MTIDKVTILGSTGMLGSACADLFPNAATPARVEFDALVDEPKFNDWVINCIGAIPQRISNPELMHKLNADLPKKLSNCNAKVIQIATDCVFSGRKGNYTEFSDKDPTDLYGKTKWEGEQSPSMKIRCSIIGPDNKDSSLFEWVKQQPEGATVFGYTDHFWNGVSTNIFAKLAKGIIESNFWQNKTFHFVPSNFVSKFELVKLIAARTNRLDLNIIEKNTGKSINRTLATAYPEINKHLWKLAGYNQIPSIQEIVEEIPL